MYQETLKQKHKMKITKRPYNVVRIMDMLTEIKILCKRNQFIRKNFAEKEPSVSQFLRVLMIRGIMAKNKSQYKWIGGEPNYEMSKSILDEVQEYMKVKKQQSLLRKKNTQTFVAESIDFPPFENIQEPIEKPISIEEPIGNEKPIEDKIRNKNKLLREENNKIAII